MQEKLGFLGPRGTFSEEAAQRLAPAGTQLLPLGAFDEVFKALHEGTVSCAVLPMENAIEGPVGIVLDRLATGIEASIEAELELPVAHALMVAANTCLEDIRCVRSHPQALAQCRQSVAKLLPQATLQTASSTAEAARSCALETGVAALAHPRAAGLYGLEVLRTDMQDEMENATRFVRLGHQPPAPSGDDKTSLVFSLPEDRAGGLVRALFAFAVRGINLTRIETRPLRTRIGLYWFFVDAAAHADEPAMREAIEELRREALSLRLLGSYPRARRP